jgi:hypothetical protein
VWLVVLLTEHVAIDIAARWVVVYARQIRFFGFRVEMKTFVLNHWLQ